MSNRAIHCHLCYRYVPVTYYTISEIRRSDFGYRVIRTHRMCLSNDVRICGYCPKPKGYSEHRMLGNTALNLRLQKLRTFFSSSSAITVTNIVIGVITALLTVLAVLLIVGAKRVSSTTDCKGHGSY